ncbi:uncharacterized protein LOC129255443 [Lytechinus pictus]|uniref:uncharacterized protein LOC129255443 n=1 Tax=Lytechinus pictus TaxID=7653 RepID=UPI0030BA2673
MAKSTPTKAPHKSDKARKKKKMALPRRILRILESGKRVHFQNVSLSKKRQMCINHYVPVCDIAVANAIDNRQKKTVTPYSKPAHGKGNKSDTSVTEKLPSTEHTCNLRPGNVSVLETSKRNDNPSISWANNERTGVSNEKDNPRKEVVALDCEMVGLGPKGRFSALARCSIVDHSGNILYDTYVKPAEPITDYRTKWSGIRPCNMVNAVTFKEAQEHVKNVLKDKIVVGHAVWNDFQVLRFSHPANNVRDTSRCKSLAEICGSKCTPGHRSLKSLAKYLLGIDIQKGEHSSVEDARAAMDLYKLVEEKWEEEIQSIFPDQDFRTCFLDDHFWPEDLI